MPIDPNIALQGRGVDSGQAINTSINAAEQLRTRDIREQILNQQSQAQQINNVQAQGQYLNQLATGLMDVPLDQRAALMAQQLPFLKQMGFNPSEILSQDLTNQGLGSVVTKTQPFMQSSQQKLTGVGDISLKDFTASSVQAFMNSGQQDFSALERVEKWTPVTLPDGSKAQISSLSGEIRYPTTTVGGQPEIDDQGQAVVPTPQVITPVQQIDAKAEAEAKIAGAKAEAVETVSREFEEEDPEVIASRRAALEKQNKSIDSTYKVVSNLDTILSSDRLDDISGTKGTLPTFRPKTKDLINTVSQLSSLLTKENLGIMSGVLSETDMNIIKGITNDIGIKFDDDGTVTGFSGSVEGTVNKLRQLKKEIVNGLRRNGYGLEGDIATNPNTGERMVFTNFEWTPM